VNGAGVIDVGLATPAVSVQVVEVLVLPWTPKMAWTVADAGPAGSQARAPARPTEAEAARARRTEVDLSMKELPTKA